MSSGNGTWSRVPYLTTFEEASLVNRGTEVLLRSFAYDIRCSIDDSTGLLFTDLRKVVRPGVMINEEDGMICVVPVPSAKDFEFIEVVTEEKE